ncbi:hypothetical protein [Treponema brennaborense]|uniref:Serine/threonine protein kinase n=1 Tax=Treponema brennaborense (strain DSM 12168 / CIP 105900 / DD5/3) TaxID=906968 RepID=F4LKW0_TREBD|nr:hypothetical protein [Treponema brennaborense]AEE16557.1 hypothetical protein Trebr_1126 [Treponema brennaborense DSM 12168]
MEQSSITVNGRRFDIVSLLGKGKGGYSYLVRGCGGEYVVKQIHHEPCSYYTFADKLEAELRDYGTLRSAGIRIPFLIDCDTEHERILKEYVPGNTVYEYVLADKDVLPYVRQVRLMCSVLYPIGINIDYFPTNFIVNRELLYYIDYECNPYADAWNFENWGITYWTKTPEFLTYAASR